MSTYAEHNDARNRDNRIAVQAWNAERARMLAATEEYELGAITLFMSKRDLQARLRESAYVGTNNRGDNDIARCKRTKERVSK